MNDGRLHDGSGSRGLGDPGQRADDVGATICAPFLSSLPVDGASISVMGTAGRQTTIAASDSLATRLEELQFDLAEGPHWQAIAENRAVLAADLDSSDGDAWPVFTPAAVRAGARAVFSFPLRLGAVVIGTVDLYRMRPGELDRPSVETAQVLAEAATMAAAGLAIRSARESEQAEPGGAPALRREVHQAIGMIIVQLDVPATDAFARLRAHAFAAGRSVHDVAIDVVGGRLDFGSLPDREIDT